LYGMPQRQRAGQVQQHVAGRRCLRAARPRLPSLPTGQLDQFRHSRAGPESVPCPGAVERIMVKSGATVAGDFFAAHRYQGSAPGHLSSLTRHLAAQAGCLFLADRPATPSETTEAGTLWPSARSEWSGSLWRSRATSRKDSQALQFSDWLSGGQPVAAAEASAPP
jgi:hypothetical protein